MLKQITIIGFLSLAIAFSANAQGSDRFDHMEKEIQEIKLRLSNLESLLNNPSKVQEVMPPGEGWKSVANWRKLATGMKASDVRLILGEPHRLDGGQLARWYYQNGGEVQFFDEKIHRWIEPRQ